MVTARVKIQDGIRNNHVTYACVHIRGTATETTASSDAAYTVPQAYLKQ